MTSFNTGSVGMSTWYQSGCGPSVAPLVSCKLCLGDFPSDHMTTVSQCRCVFCTLCLRRYVSLLLSEGLEAEVSCPDAACPERGRLLDTEIEVVVEPESMRRYRRLRFEREVLLDPGRTWCPAPSCQAVCRLQGAESAAPQAVGCPGCGLEFCSACRAQRHPGRTCPDPSGTVGRFLPGEHSSLMEGGVDDPVKPCPRCQVFIQRDQGCAQMTCRNCKHCFCWYCLDSLDEDVLLIHYDKGPCRNKLGHSRASVIWHRTQVVGTFAGFGFILLAASPFLLLAAPLFFCCPWNRSRRADDPLPT
ncbi:probable E3 ubiquitin-protein ligase RNF144A-B isoform X1 [Gadus chalcogrammus]|uniref:probable E3 ubiquitin-protein ligase RNF144A-B isoform X1 n=2 Tax=Gadus chalcogrammus TaxID=1042646 RepID=UPI0024C47861|nr:probable E3 ubiquitin-protein ligase RNF144A-B isoform X1 [Gadus chalcogrammus]